MKTRKQILALLLAAVLVLVGFPVKASALELKYPVAILYNAETDDIANLAYLVDLGGTVVALSTPNGAEEQLYASVDGKSYDLEFYGSLWDIVDIYGPASGSLPSKAAYQARHPKDNEQVTLQYARVVDDGAEIENPVFRNAGMVDLGIDADCYLLEARNGEGIDTEHYTGWMLPVAFLDDGSFCGVIVLVNTGEVVLITFWDESFDSAGGTTGPATSPTPAPTPAPTPEPTSAPTPAPTPAPTSAPTPAPTPAPTSAPTPEPTSTPNNNTNNNSNNNNISLPTPTPDPIINWEKILYIGLGFIGVGIIAVLMILLTRKKAGGTSGATEYLPPQPQNKKKWEDVPIVPKEPSLVGKKHSLVCRGGYQDGRNYPLSEGTLMIGRGPSCNISYPDDTPGVSREHAVLTLRGGVLTLRDISSRGTYLRHSGEQQVNKIQSNSTIVLKPGDHFYLATKDNEFTYVVK